MASVRVTNTKCPECSARLTVDTAAQTMKCAYCGTQLHIENKKPPRNPTMTQPRTVYVPPPMPIGARLAMFLGPIIPLVVVGTQFWPHIRSYLPVVGNQLPTTCATNGRVSITGKQFSGTGSLIVAGTNCTVVIKDSKLEADTIVEGGINVTVEVDHSTLIAKKRAIVATMNPKVRIVGKSEVSGDRGALDLGVNADVRLDDSVLRSKTTALRAEANLTLDADGGEITGAVAIDAGGWTQRVEIEGTKVTGAKKLKAR